MILSTVSKKRPVRESEAGVELNEACVHHGYVTSDTRKKAETRFFSITDHRLRSRRDIVCPSPTDVS